MTTNTENNNTKKKQAVQYQEEALQQLVKAADKINETKKTIQEDHLEEVRLKAEDTETHDIEHELDKVENRMQHMEAILSNLVQQQKLLAQQQQTILHEIKQLSETENQEEESQEEAEEESQEEPGYINCKICGKQIGVKGYSKHLRGSHDIDMREIFKDGDKYKAEGLVKEKFSNLTRALNKRKDLSNVTEIVNRRLTGEENDSEEEEEQEKEQDREPGEYEYKCPYCGDIMRYNVIARHINNSHPDEINVREFFFDEQENSYIYRKEGVEHEDFGVFSNRFSNLDVSPTGVLIDAVNKGYSSEQELAEKEYGIGVKKEEKEEGRQDNESELSDYEKAKRKASVSDRDMQIAEQAFHKIIFDHLDNIPDSHEKFISYTGNENIPGFETLYSGDLSPLNMWRKIFSNTGLLKGINERVVENFELSWERKGQTGSPKNWVVKVERTDR